MNVFLARIGALVVSTFMATVSLAVAPPLKVAVTVAPFKGLVEPMLPPGASLTVLMQPGRSEHGYEFSPSELKALVEADVVVHVGLGLEPRVEEVLKEQPNPSRQVVCFADVVGIKLSEEDHNHEHHDHAPGEACNHQGVDQHLWLDPILVKALIPAMRDAILKELGENGTPDVSSVERAKEGAKAVEASVLRVDQAWIEAASIIQKAPIVTHHNAFSRPAERYGLQILTSIRSSEGKDPSPADIANVVAEIRKANAKAIFVEPQFNPKMAQRIAKQAKIKLGTLDPLGSGDWEAMMRSNLDSLKANLSER